MPNKTTFESIRDRIIFGLENSISRRGLRDVWLDDVRDVLVGPSGSDIGASFNAIVATDIPIEIRYYVTEDTSFTESQIDEANDRLADLFAQASAQADELHAALDRIRSEMPRFCSALTQQGFEARFVEARMYVMIPTAFVCRLAPATRIVYRERDGTLAERFVCAADLDEAAKALVITIAGTDAELAERLLAQLAEGLLGYQPTKSEAKDRTLATSGA